VQQPCSNAEGVCEDKYQSFLLYLVHNDRRLVEMSEGDYASEDVLEGLLAQHPNLLAGDQMDALHPRQWLLISSERGLLSEEGGSDRWSVDHLFLNQGAVPTIVEVKRSGDARIRREAVWPDARPRAANAVIYRPVEIIRAEFEANHEDPQQLLADFLGESGTD
jgi:hypothetical protein